MKNTGLTQMSIQTNSCQVKQYQVNKSKELDESILKNILGEVPAQIFVHDKNGVLIYSNCEDLKSGKCIQCTALQCNNKCNDIDKLSQSLRQDDNEINLERLIDIDNCTLGMTYAGFSRKQIIDPNSGNIFTVTFLTNHTQQKAQEIAFIKTTQEAKLALAAQEQFLANMSHELRTPIAGMTGLLEMLMLRTTDDESRLLIKNIARSTDHLHLLVNDILDFTKLDAKKLKLDPVNSPIMLEVGELLRVHCAAALNKNLEFDFEWTPTDIKTIKIDQLRFNQIINNLLSNAIKFTSKGKVQVSMEVTQDKINIKIIDSGQGMTKKQMDNIFDPFVQADNSIGRNYGGTGLGLTIVRDLVNLMQGSISIESKKDIGTTIALEIPHTVVERFEGCFEMLEVCYEGENQKITQWLNMWSKRRIASIKTSVPSTRKRVQIIDDKLYGRPKADYLINLNSNISEFKQVSEECTELCSAPLFPDLLFETLQSLQQGVVTDGPKRLPCLTGNVLVAEDNPVNQLMLSKQLESIGLTSVLVSDGEAALKILAVNPEKFSAVITDCHMPVMNGFELAYQIRKKLPEFSSKPIIACTAEDTRLGESDSRLADFDEVLYKPFKLVRIHSLLSKYLSPQNSIINKEKQVTEQLKIKETLWIDHFELGDPTQIGNIFIDTMKSERNKLLDVDNRMNLQQIAHKIKGGASVVGANELSKAASLVEKAMIDGLDGIDDYVNDLVGLLNVELKKIESWLSSRERWNDDKKRAS